MAPPCNGVVAGVEEGDSFLFWDARTSMAKHIAHPHDMRCFALMLALAKIYKQVRMKSMTASQTCKFLYVFHSCPPTL